MPAYPVKASPPVTRPLFSPGYWTLPATLLELACLTAGRLYYCGCVATATLQCLHYVPFLPVGGYQQQRRQHQREARQVLPPQARRQARLQLWTGRLHHPSWRRRQQQQQRRNVETTSEWAFCARAALPVLGVVRHPALLLQNGVG